MQENQLTYVDENGNEILCNILFTFHSDEFKKDYVLFYPAGDEEGDDDESVDVMCASYVIDEEKNEMGELTEVTDEKEWEMIEEVFNDYMEQADGCDCEECDCEECDCEECDEECADGKCNCGCHHEK